MRCDLHFEAFGERQGGGSVAECSEVLTAWKRGPRLFTPLLPIYSGGLETSSVPRSKDVVISDLFICISVLVSKHLIHFIP